MAQYPLKDYVSLITQLLQCSEGEEWKLFRRYDHLITDELVQVLEQIAQNFLHQNDSRSASFLHQWAKEIQHHLSQQRDQSLSHNHYDDLIQMLLDCPKGHETTILNQYQSLLDDGLIERMKSIAQEFEMEGNPSKAEYLKFLLIYLDLTRQSEEVTPHSTHVLNQASTIDIQQSSIIHHLEKLSFSIKQLVNAIAIQSKSIPQLSYLEVLENAYIHQWLLTTHEIEILIGVKPHCTPPDQDYNRGGWRFMKRGKVGRDRLWQVFKILPSEAPADETMDDAPNTSERPILDDQSLLSDKIPDPWLSEAVNP